MNLPWEIGVKFLEVLAAVIMLGMLVIALGFVNNINDNARREQASTQFQREYAQLRRFQGEGVAYTEVLNAVFTLADPQLPVVVISRQEWAGLTFNGIVTDDMDNPLRFPFDADIFREWVPLVPPTGTTSIIDNPNSNNMSRNPPAIAAPNPVGGALNAIRGSRNYLGLWDGLTPTGTGESQFRVISDFLSHISRPFSNLEFDGHVLRTPSGVPYLVVFTYDNGGPINP
jgi:type II secretory pathway pseudopilin PulG